MTDRYTDLAYEQDADGVFDFVIDDDAGDFKTDDGFEAAIVVSLFSDRRAYSSEVRDPMKRRGWIGDLVSEVPNDRHGSGLWLYEQHRLTQETVIGVRTEAVQSLEWMQEESYVTHSEAMVLSNAKDREINLVVTLHFLDGGSSQRVFALADATREGLLAKL
jgi:phage gp46-like protein